MTLPCLRVAYGDESSPRAGVVAETLRALGHEVVSYEDASGFLAAAEPDLYLLGRELADGSAGIELLEALRRTGRSAPVVLLDERPSFAELRRAIEQGASEVVLRPLESGELSAAITRAMGTRAPKPRLDSEPRAHTCELSYALDEHTVGRAARELSAFLVNEGVASAHRVRIASAVAELVDNVARHAYPDGRGRVSLRAEVQRTRVQLVVEDGGKGFDPQRAQLESVPPALPGARGARRTSLSSAGLGRVARLCESHAIASDSKGTRVELSFELTPVRFQEENELAETDFLDPSRARSLIASLRQGRTDLSGVPPAMALTLGRILGGLDAEARLPRPRS